MLDNATSLEQAADASLWLNTDGLTGGKVWLQVEESLRAGQRVWLCGAHVEPLAQKFGIYHEGRHWLPLTPRPDSGNEWLLRARDVLLAGLALILFAPLLLVLAVLIKRSSAGPVFYRAQVIGLGRRAFTWFKLRSMYIGQARADEQARRQAFHAHVQGNGKGKVIDDTRVTRVGRFMRKYSLDEVPQLWNVLRGEMTLVGPRPCLPYEAELFPPWARRRFAIRPGLTGIWQVLGRGRVSVEDGLGMDVYYTYARSFTLDLKVMVLTIGVMLAGTGGQ